MATHVITGGGSGIGAAIVERLRHRDGDELYLIVRDENRARQVAERWPGTRVLTADLEHPARLGTALAGRLPDRIGSLIHAAGVVRLGPVAELPPADWQRTLAVNLAAPAELTRLALPGLRATRGQVIFINSGSGLRASPDWSAYAASKHGLRALADSLRAEEHGASGVRVTTIYPGRTATPMQESVRQQEGQRYEPARYITASSVATTVLTALDLPADAEITDLTVRPGRF